MATKQEKKVKVEQPQAEKASTETKGSIGIIRASEKAHLSVTNIPLDFMSDIGIMPKQMEFIKDANGMLVGSVYTVVDAAVQVPGKLAKFVFRKVTKSDDKAAVAKPKAEKEKGKEIVKAKAKPKAAAKAAKPKVAAKPKAAAKSAKSKVAAKPKTVAKAAKPKVAAKPKAAVAQAAPKVVAKPKAAASVH
jgi:Tfp pilus assembly protein FimV